MTASGKDILLAIVGAAHGIRGEVRVRAFTGDPMALAGYGPLHDGTGRAFEILSLRPAGNVVIARFKGISDRSAAEALPGVELFVDRTALPRLDEEDAFYHADLIGLSVRGGDGLTIGQVLSVQNFGAGDLLEIEASGRSAFIPLTRAAVPQIDIPGGNIVIDPAAAGLSEDVDAGEPPPRMPKRGGRRKAAEAK